MAMLFRNDVENTGTASSSETSNRLFFVYTFGTAEFANAWVVRRWGRPDRKYDAELSTKALIAGNYVEIAVRPQRP